MKKIILALSFFGFSQYALALECTRPVEQIFTGYSDSGNKIYIKHSDGYKASVVKLPYIDNDEKYVDRMLAVLLAGYLGGKDIQFRYLEGEDGSAASCKPGVSQITQAVRIKN